jgi:hypothetical protein
LAYEPFSEDGKRARLLGVGARDGVTAAVGFATSALHGSQRPVLWVLDGGRLRETYLLRELFGGTRLIATGRMSAGPRGFLVCGTRTGAGDRQTAQVWRADAPPDWARIDDQPALASGPHEQVWAFDVASGPARDVVVGRADRTGNGGVNPTDAAAWYSDDGRTWQRAAGPVFDQPGPQQFNRVAAVGGGFVAVGSEHGVLAAWGSLDGASWRRMADFPLAAEPNTPMAVDRDLLAVVLHGQLRLFDLAGRRLHPPKLRGPATGVALRGGTLAVTTAQGVEVFTRPRR